MIRADRSRFKRLVIAVLLAAVACIPVFAGLPEAQTVLAQRLVFQTKRSIFGPGRADLNPQPPQPYPYALRGKAKVIMYNGGDVLVRLTEDGHQAEAGALWAREKQDLSTGFETTFDVRIKNQEIAGQPTADGFTFVIHNDPRGLNAIGSNGCGMGYGGITNSVAIKFDTYPNPPDCPELNEPAQRHISVLTSGSMTWSHPWVTPAINFADGESHTVRISYDVFDNTINNRLIVWLDGRGVFQKNINLSTYVGGSNSAWIGMTAATGRHDASHDFRNWYIGTPGTSCGLTYDFTQPMLPGSSNQWSHFNNLISNGERRIQWARFNRDRHDIESINPTDAPTDSVLKIHRGVYEPGVPSLEGFLIPKDGLDPHLTEFVNNGQPVETVLITYTMVPSDANGLLDLSFTFGQGEDPSINHSESVSLSSSQKDPQTGIRSNFIRLWTDIPNPTGMLLEMRYPDSNYQIRLKAISFCIHDQAPPRPPVIPFGGWEACNNLLDNIKQRFQPFGGITISSSLPPITFTIPISRQEEFQFPDNVFLDPYPEYNLGAAGFPPSMNYDRRAWPAGTSPPILVPCVFRSRPVPDPLDDSNRPIYNPDGSNTPIIRFTAVGGTPEAREHLVLLNYAAYFSLGSANWCFAGDTVFGSAGTTERTTPTKYGPGYNIPAPGYPCDPNTPSAGAGGPCGSFAGTLNRAMGYFNLDAIGPAFETAPSWAKFLDMHNLYYGAWPYQKVLPRNRNNFIDPVFVRLDNSDPAQYRTRPVSFRGIRAYSTLDGDYAYGVVQADGQVVNPLRCNEEDELCKQTNEQLNHTPDGLEIIRSPMDQTPDELAPPVPTDVWKDIKPGDIAITIVEGKNDAEVVDTLYTHVQIVVGWGPKVYHSGVRYGADIYPTYDSLPAAVAPEDYVPYVIDRYFRPREGFQPRPFNYNISHTATDFWVATP